MMDLQKYDEISKNKYYKEIKLINEKRRKTINKTFRKKANNHELEN